MEANSTLSEAACAHIAELMAPAFSEILSSGARITPTATDYLVAAGADVSFKRSAQLLEMSGDSAVSAMSAMRAVRKAGELPRLTREMSATPKRRERAEARTMSSLAAKVDAKVPLSVGRGREAEHSASLAGAPAKVRYAAGLDSGMVAAGW